MNENEEAKLKRNLILEAIKNLSDEDILKNENFTYWGKPGGEPGVVTQSHETGHPPGPPPDPPPGGGQ